MIEGIYELGAIKYETSQELDVLISLIKLNHPEEACKPKYLGWPTTALRDYSELEGKHNSITTDEVNRKEKKGFVAKYLLPKIKRFILQAEEDFLLHESDILSKIKTFYLSDTFKSFAHPISGRPPIFFDKNYIHQTS